MNDNIHSPEGRRGSFLAFSLPFSPRIGHSLLGVSTGIGIGLGLAPKVHRLSGESTAEHDELSHVFDLGPPIALSSSQRGFPVLLPGSMD